MYQECHCRRSHMVGDDKFELKKEYKKLSEKLGYSLFDENYLILNANP